MNFSEKVLSFRPKLRRGRGGGRPGGRAGGRVAVVHWDRESIDFLVYTPKSNQLASNQVGSLDWTAHEHPLAALAEHLNEQSLGVQRLIILLSRPRLDMVTLNLPVANAAELPTLVASEVEQRLGDADEPPVVDYCVLASGKSQAEPAAGASPDGQETASRPGLTVLAFAMQSSELERLREEVSQHGFRLAGICPRHIAPLGVLRRRHLLSETVSVTVHLYANEVELILCQQDEPVFLRSLRVHADDAGKAAEQIALEVQRCTTLLPPELAEAPMGWSVFMTSAAASEIAEQLQQRVETSVQTIDPLTGWKLETPAKGEDDETAVSNCRLSAATAGTALDHQRESLPVNLLAPKRAPPAPNPARRWAVIGAAAALVIAVGVHFMLADVRDLRTQVHGLETQLEEAEKLADKYQERADQVAAVENWMSDQVDWLTVLDDLSDRLPRGNQATVRRLTASVSGDTGIIDLSVQVAEQDDVSELESRIRSVKYSVSSKRISQKADTAEYPWQFETRVVFPVETARLDSIDTTAYAPPDDASAPSPSDRPPSEQVTRDATTGSADSAKVAGEPIGDESSEATSSAFQPIVQPTERPVAQADSSATRIEVPQ
jgi:hypothetical protein